MTPADHRLVRLTFQRLVPVADLAAALFHARLFALDPALRGTAPGELHGRGRRLMARLARIVDALDRPEQLRPLLRAFCHHPHAVSNPEQHYASVGAALLWMLARILGTDFTPAVRAAWSDTYAGLAAAALADRRCDPLAA